MNAESADRPAPPHRHRDEMRVYGRNACLALFAQRPHDLRKVYLLQTRIPDLKAVLAWCVQKKLGYRVVESADLDKLTGSQHHEGVCFEVRRRAPQSLTALLQRLAPRKQALLAWLDGVANPHNFGAVLRSAANFGVDGVVVSGDAALAESGAALRVAEGGADAVPLARIAPGEDAFGALRNAGFSIAATVPREGEALFATRLPQRLVYALGAEGAGLSRGLIDRADLHVSIPGTGAVESLNVAASAAVLFGEYWRQHRQPKPERQPRR